QLQSRARFPRRPVARSRGLRDAAQHLRAGASAPELRQSLTAVARMQVDARHRFENFITGSANRLAVAAAHAVGEQPGLTYNPLFIYSSSGLGKTHLIGVIGNTGQQRDKNVAVENVTLDDFVEQLHAAIATNEADRFKQRYGRVDV